MPPNSWFCPHIALENSLTISLGFCIRCFNYRTEWHVATWTCKGLTLHLLRSIAEPEAKWQWASLILCSNLPLLNATCLLLTEVYNSPKHLIQQIWQPVRWRELVHGMCRNGPYSETIYEPSWAILVNMKGFISAVIFSYADKTIWMEKISLFIFLCKAFCNVKWILCHCKQMKSSISPGYTLWFWPSQREMRNHEKNWAL